MRNYLAALGTVALAASLTATASTAASASQAAAFKSYTVTASTAISNRPDSGNAGYWADDNYTRTASATLQSEVALSYCGGTSNTGHCYHWTGSIKDKGTFTTIPGSKSPGAGSGGAVPIGVAATGTMNGGYSYDFYSSWKTAKTGLVPPTEDDAGNVPGGRMTTDAWPEQFFGAGARFYVGNTASNSLGTTGRWAYTLPFGADSACRNMASQWVDSSWPVSQAWGTAPYQGNILAPDAGSC